MEISGKWSFGSKTLHDLLREQKKRFNIPNNKKKNKNGIKKNKRKQEV